MFCYADHVAYTSARCTGVGWGGVGHANVMYACVTCNTPRYATSMCTCVAHVLLRWPRCLHVWTLHGGGVGWGESNEVQMGVLLYVETQRQVWKHAEFKDFERNLVALSEKDAVRKLFTLYRLQKKTENFPFFFGHPDVKNERFVETHIQMKTSKIKCFFSRPWWLKLVFRWGETPISTLESCACHRKMIMTLKCPFTKSHKYHVSSFWRENLKIKIGNPSQGAVSTAYLVFTRLSCLNIWGEDVKTKLSCETSFKFWKFESWKRSPSWQFHCGADPTMIWT